MEIVKGFGRFTNGEQVEVDVQESWLTRNGKLCLKMKNNNGEIFSNNIPEQYKNLRGRCMLTCTGVGDNGFPFVDIKKIQDSSWDVHDEVNESYDQLLSVDLDEVMDKIDVEDVFYSILLTHQYESKLRYSNDVIKEHLAAIQDELHAEYGRQLISTVRDDDFELS